MDVGAVCELAICLKSAFLRLYEVSENGIYGLDDTDEIHVSPDFLNRIPGKATRRDRTGDDTYPYQFTKNVYGFKFFAIGKSDAIKDNEEGDVAYGAYENARKAQV